MNKIFKRFWFFPLVAIALMSCFMLTSCKDDDKGEPVSKNELLIIGEWSQNGDGYYQDYYRIVFLENGTGYDKVRNGSSYNIDETFEWSVKGSDLLMVWESGGTESNTIISITAKELIIRDDDSFFYYTRVN